jgi:hypothetical protein
MIALDHRNFSNQYFSCVRSAVCSARQHHAHRPPQPPPTRDDLEKCHEIIQSEDFDVSNAK